MLMGQASSAISAKFSAACQTLAQFNINPRQGFEGILILWFPKEPQQPGFTEGVSKATQNELNYCEALLIHIFQTLCLSYNTVLVPPTNTSCLPQPQKAVVPNPNALKPSRTPCMVGGDHAAPPGERACVVEGKYFNSPCMVGLAQLARKL